MSWATFLVEITAKDIARVLMRVEKRSRNSAHKVARRWALCKVGEASAVGG